MRLSEYLKDRGITKKEFARRAGINSQTLYNILWGREPRLTIACKIIKASEGKITFEELIPLEIEQEIASISGLLELDSSETYVCQCSAQRKQNEHTEH